MISGIWVDGGMVVRGCTSTLRAMVASGNLLIFGCVMDSRSGAVIEAYHGTGYDALLIDREHTGLNSETVLEHIRLARALGFPCMVRVADDSYHELNRTLDQAPDGVFVPRIRTRMQVEQVMQTVRYPPLGVRGLAGSTCPIGRYVGWPSVEEQVTYVNQEVVVGIQIETKEALADLDGILSVPGVDIAVVGNDDLSLGMGIPGQTMHPDYLAVVARVIAACRYHGVMPGIAAGDPAYASYWVTRGMRAIWYGSDIGFLWRAAAEQILNLRKTLES